MPKLVTDYNPRAALDRARLASRMIDRARGSGSRGGHVPSIGPVRAVPDHELIATLVAHGMPLVCAKAVEHNPQQRFVALRFWSDVDSAGKGDPEAKARVDFCRGRWDRLRRDGLVADDSRRVH